MATSIHITGTGKRLLCLHQGCLYLSGHLSALGLTEVMKSSTVAYKN